MRNDGRELRDVGDRVDRNEHAGYLDDEKVEAMPSIPQQEYFEVYHYQGQVPRLEGAHPQDRETSHLSGLDLEVY